MTFTTLIDAESLRKLLDESAASEPAAAGATVILDCRFDLGDAGAGRRAYSTAHIPGARHADLNRDLASPVTPSSGRHPLPERGTLRGFFASLGIGDHSQVIVYDETNGSFAARAWWLLRWLGHREVAVLDGGFKAWIAAGGAVEAGEPPPKSARGVVGFTGAGDLQPDGFATTADVLRALDDPERLLVDARAPERYAGTVEPIDPVAGHVPGAVNHPFTGNLEPDGRFLPAPELRRRWLERLGGTLPANVTLMCGSGVTACHNLLAMEVAGLPGAHLYAGSWSEWIRNPERPVARGSEP